MNSYIPYLNWIDSQENLLLQRVKQWVEVNSFSFNTAGLNTQLKLLEQAFLPFAGHQSMIPLPSHPILNTEGKFIPHPIGNALQIRKRPEAPHQILLAGHYDTVFSPSTPFQHMTEKTPDIWNGPGCADMKGGLAILLTTLEALERSPFAEKIGWEVLITPDEEIGSPCSTPLYEAAAARHHAGLIFEPSFPDGTFVRERKGSSTFTIVFKGRAAHVGRDFSKGQSAVFAIARFIHLVQQIDTGKDLIINVADLEGKGPVNIVPPLASCRINLRSTHPQTLASASATLHQAAKQCVDKEGLHYELEEDSIRPPKPFDKKTEALFHAYESCAAALKIPFQTCSTGGVCDGNNLSGAGLPTLDTAGAIGGCLHTPDEYLIQSSLVERSKLAALFLFKIATGDINLQQGARQ